MLQSDELVMQLQEEKEQAHKKEVIRESEKASRQLEREEKLNLEKKYK